MAANRSRKEGSKLGRATTDREQEFAYYASLPPNHRTYQAVADEFGLSGRTVERHGRTGRWKERSRVIDDQAAEQIDALVGEARVEQTRKTIKLIDASLVVYADKLRRNDIRMTPRDLELLQNLH